MTHRVLELFAGLGGLACAAGGHIESVAIDIDQHAKRVFVCNYGDNYITREIESLSSADLRALDCDSWWLSPPCQPYSRRGHQHDINDPRARSLLHVVKLMNQLRPAVIALENVPGFFNSQAYRLLRDQLDANGYHVAEQTVCPTQLGWPNRRPRFYMLASLNRLLPWQPLPNYDITLAKMLGKLIVAPEQLAALSIDVAIASKYGRALDRVRMEDAAAVTACFGSSYGKSLLHAGSYLESSSGLRRFHPREVACLLGFPESFTWPADLTDRQLWKLLGNSLSIPVVQYIIGHLGWYQGSGAD